MTDAQSKEGEAFLFKSRSRLVSDFILNKHKKVVSASSLGCARVAQISYLFDSDSLDQDLIRKYP